MAEGSGLLNRRTRCQKAAVRFRSHPLRQSARLRHRAKWRYRRFALYQAIACRNPSTRYVVGRQPNARTRSLSNGLSGRPVGLLVSPRVAVRSLEVDKSKAGTCAAGRGRPKPPAGHLIAMPVPDAVE